jgi:hypothetical protein
MRTTSPAHLILNCLAIPIRCRKDKMYEDTHYIFLATRCFVLFMFKYSPAYLPVFNVLAVKTTYLILLKQTDNQTENRSCVLILSFT